MRAGVLICYEPGYQVGRPGIQDLSSFEGKVPFLICSGILFNIRQQAIRLGRVDYHNVEGPARHATTLRSLVAHNLGHKGPADIPNIK